MDVEKKKQNISKAIVFMDNEKKLSNEQSLLIIHQMINQAKTNINDNGFGWLLWGSILFLASISTYIFIDINADNTFLAWNFFGILSILLLAYEIIFKSKKKLVRTYVDDLLRLVNIGFIVCIFSIIFAMNVAVRPSSGFGFFLMIFGFLMLIKGGTIKFKPLIIGAVVNWLGAIAIFIVHELKYTMLIMAAAVLIGYIIPGLMLRASSKRLKNSN